MDPVEMLAQSNPESLTHKAERMVENVFSHKYVVGIVGTLAVALLARYMPKLPRSVEKLVDNIVGHFVMLFVVAYVLTRNVKVAVASTLVVLILVLGAKVVLPEYMKNVAQQEHRLVEHAPVSVKEGVLTEVAPLNSETVGDKVAEVDGYTNLWMYNGEVESEEVVGSVEVAPTVSPATTLTATAASSVAAPVGASMAMNVSAEVVEPHMPPVPNMPHNEAGSMMDKFNELKNKVTGAVASVRSTLPNEVNPSAVSGVMSAKQTNLGSR